MKKRIEDNWSKNKLDAFLKEKFGYGIWEFELSLYQAYVTYLYSKSTKIQKMTNEKIKELQDLKEKILALLDDFMSKINFYKKCTRFKIITDITGVSKWSTQERKKFIIKNYKLDQLFTIIDRQINFYQAIDFKLEMEGVLWGIESLSQLKLKPINFLVLVWNFAMKKENKVDWINMEKLLIWFSENVDEKALPDFLNSDNLRTYSPEILRSTRNKYNNSRYEKLAHYLYQNFFKNAQDDFKKKYPIIVANLKKLYLGGNEINVEEWQRSYDILACLTGLFPDYFPPCEFSL